jgi:hypothetical protein
VCEPPSKTTLQVLGLPHPVNQKLLALYLENRGEVREIMDHHAMRLPSYQNMHWRLDAQIASRTLKQQVGCPLVCSSARLPA